MDMGTIKQGICDLQKRGYSAVCAGDHIIVKDPQHKCGTGADSGSLMVTGYAALPLHSGNAVTKFLYDRT